MPKKTTIWLSAADEKVIAELRALVGEHREQTELIRTALRVMLKVAKSQTWKV